ncbi:MAG: oxidoreductase [Deltaproteobacteria bacterium RBG_16_48_10]|nr:MAG: oxidoreductase [Deltaproteobacteria bacterium RBG_16_48_10]
MQKKKVRAGIIGSGFAASFHYEALHRVHGTEIEITGVYSPTKTRRKAFAHRKGIRAFETLEQIIDHSDAIHVCTPPSMHESVAVAALSRDKFAIVEKPLTGYFGGGSETFHGDHFPRQVALDHSLQSIGRILDAEKKSQGKLLYAENWVYAPSIQKEREIIEKTRAQILWMHGEEGHSGSHAATYGSWKFSGGGSMIGKGCHPLAAALYLKRVEGRARKIKPIQPRSVSARVHALTREKRFIDRGHLRADYHDIEDFSIMHVTFQDGMIADIFASDIVMGGTHNWLEIAANNHRTFCNINPNTAMQTYNPVDQYFKDIYVVEKIGTKQGWSNPAPDEDWITGYPAEIEAFYRTIAYGEPLESDSSLAADAISTIYSAYLSAEKRGAEIVIQTF